MELLIPGTALIHLLDGRLLLLDVVCVKSVIRSFCRRDFRNEANKSMTCSDSPMRAPQKSLTVFDSEQAERGVVVVSVRNGQCWRALMLVVMMA